MVSLCANWGAHKRGDRFTDQSTTVTSRTPPTGVHAPRTTATNRNVNQTRHHSRSTRGYQRPRRKQLAHWGKDQYLAEQYRIPEEGSSACGPAWTARKENELERHGKRCQGCGWESENSNDYNNDHKTPIKHGGSNNWRNLQILCAPCNTGKNDMTDSEWRAAEKPHKKPKEWSLAKYQEWLNQH